MIQFCFRFFILFTFSFFSIAPSWADNYIHDPNFILEDHPSGSKTPLLRHATSASYLHIEGNKGGQALNGRRPKAAIIDLDFNPHHTQSLIDKGVIHPLSASSLNNNVILPEDGLDRSWSSDPYHLSLYKEIRKEKYDEVTKNGALNHGSAVMEALHQIAPESQILPIDLNFFCSTECLTRPKGLAKAIRNATAEGVDVINLSLTFRTDLIDTDTIEAFKEAVNKGVIFVKSAGNDGYSSLWKTAIDYFQSLFIKPMAETVFKAVDGKGILYVGSLKYKSNGQEEISSFSQRPDPNDTGKKPHFFFAPGENVQLPIESKKSTLTEGTSFSAPAAAGGVLLMLKHAWDKGYAASPEDILNILEESGNTITHNGWFSKTDYKSLDLFKARQLMDRKFERNVVPPSVPPAIPVSLPTPAVTRPIPVVTPPAPTVIPPAPVVTRPIPVVTPPAPVVTLPAPVVTRPIPVVAPPAPVIANPTVTPVPVFVPSPPVMTQPEPEPEPNPAPRTLSKKEAKKLKAAQKKADKKAKAAQKKEARKQKAAQKKTNKKSKKDLKKEQKKSKKSSPKKQKKKKKKT